MSVLHECTCVFCNFVVVSYYVYIFTRSCATPTHTHTHIYIYTHILLLFDWVPRGHTHLYLLDWCLASTYLLLLDRMSHWHIYIIIGSDTMTTYIYINIWSHVTLTHILLLSCVSHRPIYIHILLDRVLHRYMYSCGWFVP